MIYRVSADILFILHFCFVLFVVFGGVLVLYRRPFKWLHLPALAWGILVEFLQLPCPLTILEKYLIEMSGQSAYADDFIQHYISAIIYPGITPQIMISLGILLIAFNLFVYFWVFRQNNQREKV